MYNDEIENKMDLEFNETKKEESSVIENNEETNDSVEQISENEFRHSTNNEVQDQQEVIEQPKEVEKEEKTKEKKPKKEKKVKEKATPEQSKATKKLLIGIGWVFILILSIVFGANSIYDFINKFDHFIDTAKTANASGDVSDALWATGQFFEALLYSFEAMLFIFFVLLSLKMSISNFIPWSKYRKATLPERQDKQIDKLKKQESNEIDKLYKMELTPQYQEFTGEKKEKEIKHLKSQISRYKKLYSAKKAEDKKAKAGNKTNKTETPPE